MSAVEIRSSMREMAGDWGDMPRDIKKVISQGMEAMGGWEKIGETGLLVTHTINKEIEYIDFGPDGIFFPPGDDDCDQMLQMAKRSAMFAVGMCEYMKRHRDDSFCANKLIGLTNHRMAGFLCDVLGEATSCYWHEIEDYKDEVWIVLDLRIFKSDRVSRQRLERIAKAAKKRWGCRMEI